MRRSIVSTDDQNNSLQTRWLQIVGIDSHSSKGEKSEIEVSAENFFLGAEEESVP